MAKTNEEIEKESPRYSKHWRTHEYWVRYSKIHCGNCNHRDEYSEERSNLNDFIGLLRSLLDEKSACKPIILDIGKDVFYLDNETKKTKVMCFKDIHTEKPMDLGWLDNKLKELRLNIEKSKEIIYELESFKYKMEAK